MHPFHGYRYNEEKVQDLNKVVSQPYDKIDSKTREELYQNSDFNIVRMILSKAELNKDKYQVAAEDLKNWIDNDILLREDKPAFYAYWQEYEVNGKKKVRKGFVGMGKVEGEEGVKAHENTMDGPKADRLNLTRATEANFGHIFMLYSDKEKKIINLLDGAISDEQLCASVKDEDGNSHLLWKITDKSVIETIQKEMKDKILYIADGHHRYQTAVNYRNECLEKGWKSIGAEGFENRLMTFVNIDDPGMSILPTHRLVYGLAKFDLEGFIKDAEKDFDIKEYDNAELLYQKMDQDQGKCHTIGFKAKESDSYYSLTLKDEKIMESLLAEKSAVWRNLDVVVLHKAILERYLNIDEKALADKTNTDYIRYREEALNIMENNQEKNYQAAFLLNSTPVEDVQKVANEGERMPQKSTDFYPKLLTGLVINKLEIEK
ncbi:DUF1015 domain-containing protein [Natronospora cellulosivora (SeqCode)]